MNKITSFRDAYRFLSNFYQYPFEDKGPTKPSRNGWINKIRRQVRYLPPQFNMAVKISNIDRLARSMGKRGTENGTDPCASKINDYSFRTATQ